MRHYLSLFLLLIALVACRATSHAEELSIINPGFEMATGRDGFPDGWTLRREGPEASEALPAYGLKSWQYDKHVSHSGAASIRTGVADTNDVGVWEQGGIEIPPGTRYLRLTVWIKSEDVRSSGGIVNLTFRDRSGKLIGNDVTAVAVSSSHDWTPYTRSAAVPEGAATASLVCAVKYAFTNCGTFWFDDFRLATADEPFTAKTFYADDNPLPEVTSGEKERGFILFSRNYLRVLLKNAIPLEKERTASLEINACPGEFEPATLTIRALRPLKDVTLSVSDLQGPSGIIDAGRIDVRAIRYMPKEGEGRWGLFQEALMDEVPLMLEKIDHLSIADNENQTYWLTAHVPEGQAPGTYRGNVTIKTSDRGSADIPLTLKVYPFELMAPPKGITFALYVRAQNNPEWIAETFADMRVHGLTTFALFASGPDMGIAGGKIQINWNGGSAFEQYLQAHPRARFTEPVVWLMDGHIVDLCKKFGPIESDSFAQTYRDLISEIVRHGKESGWPEIIFQPVDEAFEWEQNLPEMLRLSQLLKSVPGVRTEADGMNGKWENFGEEAYQLTDVFNLHDGPALDRHKPVDLDAWWKFYTRAVSDGKRIWFYNIDITAWHPEPVRFMSGFGLYKSRAHGIVPQAYMFPVNPDDPGAVYDSPASRSSWTLARFPAARNRSGGPTIAYEAFREGIDDYRYLATLREALDRAYRSGDAKTIDQANAISEPVLAKLDSATFNGCTGLAMQGNWTGTCEILPNGRRLVRGDHKIDNNWQFEDYDALRRQIADGIARLENLMKR